MRILTRLVLIGLLLCLQTEGVVHCPETSCCDSGKADRDQDCDTSCPPCACCLDRSPVEAVAIEQPAPVVFVSGALCVVVTAPPSPEPSDIFKIPKTPLV
jgi:hypothetical protein